MHRTGRVKDPHKHAKNKFYENNYQLTGYEKIGYEGTKM